MGAFQILYLQRSDGKIEIRGRLGTKEKNEPLPAQLDPTPGKDGISDYYRALSEDDAKHLEWRRKLGGMLAREIQGSSWQGKDGHLH